jgi:hypothetical protein
VKRRAARRPQRAKDVLHGQGSKSTGEFRCVGCRLAVPLRAPGTGHRNHCPTCLASRHVDRRIPGDRAADCGGRMDAVGLTARADGEWLLVHQCRSCGALGTNRIAGDDNALALVRLAMRPLADAAVARRVLLTL